MFLPAVERAAAGFGSLSWGIRENKCLDRLGLQLVPTQWGISLQQVWPFTEASARDHLGEHT